MMTIKTYILNYQEICSACKDYVDFITGDTFKGEPEIEVLGSGKETYEARITFKGQEK